MCSWRFELYNLDGEPGLVEKFSFSDKDGAGYDGSHRERVLAGALAYVGVYLDQHNDCRLSLWELSCRGPVDQIGSYTKSGKEGGGGDV